MWINHHAAFRRLASVDHSVLLLNLLLLLCIVELPFATSLLATYLDAPNGGRLAALFYAGSFLLTSSVFAAMEFHIVLRRPHLLHTPLAESHARAVLARTAIAPPAYVLAGVLGLISPFLTLIMCAALGVFYVLPQRSGAHPARRGEDEPLP